MTSTIRVGTDYGKVVISRGEIIYINREIW